MSLTARYKTNSELEIKGAKYELPANDDGTIPTFYLARMSNANPRYLKVLNQVMKPYQREIQLGTLSEEKAKELQIRIFVDAILTGWENILASDVTGDPNAAGYLDFSKQYATMLLERLPELHRVLSDFASDMSNYLEVNREEAAKN